MRITARALDATITKQVRLRYLLALPDDAVAPPWPLLLFLHGSGERGTDLARVSMYGVPKELALGRRLPFVVVAPQCPARTTWSAHLDALIALLDHVQATHPIDAGRVTVTGLSMGGTGTWEIAVAHPDRFAALAPVCGSDAWCVGDASQLCVIRHVPVWAFHGARDDVIPPSASRRLVDALRQCGGDAELTLLPEQGHACWEPVYATPELYTWLHAQRNARRV
ncbi:MAG TPA: PHB depolymerase family esterase [Gemmatimonadaceae bacterium]